MPSSATAQSSHSPSTTTGARKEDPAKTVDRVVRYLTLPDGEVTLCAPLLLPPPLELCTALDRASTLGAELTTGTAGPATPWCLASRVGAAIPPKENDRKKQRLRKEKRVVSPVLSWGNSRPLFMGCGSSQAIPRKDAQRIPVSPKPTHPFDSGQLDQEITHTRRARAHTHTRRAHRQSPSTPPTRFHTTT